jgi:hypothetical protein
MIRHVVLFRFTPETTAADVEAIADALRELPAAIPEIAAYRFGTDLGINEGNADFAVVADFASTEDYLTYRDHPRHQAVIKEHIAPHLAERTAVQFAFD